MPYMKAKRPLAQRPVRSPLPLRAPKSTSPDNDAVLAVLKRAEGKCEVCGRQCASMRGWDWSAHHRRGRQGWRTDNSVSNLLLVCRSCHDRIHQAAKSWAEPLGYWISRNWGPPPAEVPVRIVDRWVLLTDGGYVDVEPPDGAP